jgi:hypothetical protein
MYLYTEFYVIVLRILYTCTALLCTSWFVLLDIMHTCSVRSISCFTIQVLFYLYSARKFCTWGTLLYKRIFFTFVRKSNIEKRQQIYIIEKETCTLPLLCRSDALNRNGTTCFSSWIARTTCGLIPSSLASLCGVRDDLPEDRPLWRDARILLN